MITVRSPLPSHLEIARRQMERYLERVTAIEAKVETERKRRLDERRAREAAEAVEREAEKARRQAKLEAEAAQAAQADAEIRTLGIIPISAILGACAVFYGVPISCLFAERRTKGIVKPRQIAMYLAKELTPRSLPDIERRIGGRDRYDRPPRRAQDRRAHQEGSQPRRRGGDHPSQDCGAHRGRA